MSKITITERGWAGHYILAKNCKFRRNTLISYNDEHIIVFTMGNCVHLNKIEEIGYKRYYETLIFTGVKGKTYIDIDIDQQLFPKHNLPWSVDHNSYEADFEANNIHERTVKWVSENFELCLDSVYDADEDDL